MIYEDFVTYEQADKLCDLGFDFKCIARYYEEEFEITSESPTNYNSDRYRYDLISAPTLAQAQKWLREVKDIIIGIDFDNWHNKYICHLYKRMGYSGENIRDTYGSRLVTNEFHEDFDTYEDALSAGIDKALNSLNNII